VLPNLIVIGAERCGTTSLHRYLASHPDVFMSRMKELDFFVAERNWRRGRVWYERQFRVDAPVRGETSPTYTAYPHYMGVPERIASVVPDVKLLYVVRDPVERTLSAVHLARGLGLEPRDATEALRDAERSPYVTRSRYATQLERYLGHIPSSAIEVVDSHQLCSDRRRTLGAIFRFLGVREDAWTPAMEIEFNRAKQRRRNRAGKALWPIARWMLGDPRTRSMMARAPGWLATALTAPLSETTVDPDLRSELESVLGEEARRLRQLTGQRFESWSV
jgi:sulfotransferase family protein